METTKFTAELLYEILWQYLVFLRFVFVLSYVAHSNRKEARVHRIVPGDCHVHGIMETLTANQMCFHFGGFLSRCIETAGSK